MRSISRFPSLRVIVAGARDTLFRFPYTLASAAVATATMIYLIESKHPDAIDRVAQVAMVASLGLSLFTALSAFAERRDWQATGKRWFPAFGILLLCGYYLTLPANLEEPHFHLMRYALIAIGFHFLVAVLPYAGRAEVQGFWQYNKSLFLGLLSAVVYSQVLYGGLAIALLSIDKLFGVDIRSELYGDLWAVMVGIANTWIFLAHIPRDLDALNESRDYPHGLKVLAQYILLPLVVLYFCILIAYEAKILITWNWPRGWVSQLVLWFSVVGILSLLLLYPLQQRVENRWIARFGRWYFRGLLPLLVMLYLAIWQRISQYGVTVNRYLVVAMSVGLTVVILYMVFSKARDIRIIPVVLFILALASAYGPWSAFSVSLRSQQQRLTGLLAETGLSSGERRAGDEPVPLETRRELTSIIVYLAEWHGAEAFSKWFDSATVATWADSGRSYTWRQDVADSLGFAWADPWVRGDSEYFRLNAQSLTMKPQPVTGYDYLLEYNYHSVSDSQQQVVTGEQNFYVRFDTGTGVLSVAWGDSLFGEPRTARIDLRTPVVGLWKQGHTDQIDPAQVTFDAAGEDVSARLIVRYVAGRFREEVAAVESLSGWLLIGRPAPD